MISSLFELVSSLMELMIKPLLIVKLSCQFGVRSICFILWTWIELVRCALHLQLVIFWKSVIGATALLSLPARVFTALSREKMLVAQLYRMKIELENILLERNELEELLHNANKERRVVEVMLKEVEEEHDEAIVKIELLEGEVQNLKKEIQMLKETQGKALWDYKGEGAGNGYSIRNNIGQSLWKSFYNENASQQILNEDLIKAGLKIYRTDRPLNTESLILKDGVFLSKQRDIARSRSLFSAMLSLVVGLIVWKAEEPCMPLVMALFIVVLMSFTSVARFYSTIEHKPASEAVALLSFNWFILGTLMYPTLPMVAHALSSLCSIFLGRTRML